MRTDSGHVHHYPSPRSKVAELVAPGCSPYRPLPIQNTLSAFERLIAELDIPESCWPNHPRVKAFVRANAEHHYVPEELLVRLGVRVRADLT